MSGSFLHIGKLGEGEVLAWEKEIKCTNQAYVSGSEGGRRGRETDQARAN